MESQSWKTARDEIQSACQLLGIKWNQRFSCVCAIVAKYRKWWIPGSGSIVKSQIQTIESLQLVV